MRKDWEKWSRELRKRVQEQLDLSRELSDEEVQELIDREILKTSRENCLLLEESCGCKRNFSIPCAVWICFRS